MFTERDPQVLSNNMALAEYYHKLPPGSVSSSRSGVFVGM